MKKVMICMSVAIVLAAPMVDAHVLELDAGPVIQTPYDVFINYDYSRLFDSISRCTFRVRTSHVLGLAIDEDGETISVPSSMFVFMRAQGTTGPCVSASVILVLDGDYHEERQCEDVLGNQDYSLLVSGPVEIWYGFYQVMIPDVLPIQGGSAVVESVSIEVDGVVANETCTMSRIKRLYR